MERPSTIGLELQGKREGTVALSAFDDFKGIGQAEEELGIPWAEALGGPLTRNEVERAEMISRVVDGNPGMEESIEAWRE